MMRRSRLTALLTLAIALAAAGDGFSQSTSGGAPPDIDALRQQIERRFEVLPLRDGIALRPKAARRGIRSIEVAGDTISIDGAPATGTELREKLGADGTAAAERTDEPPAQRAVPSWIDRLRGSRRCGENRRGEYATTEPAPCVRHMQGGTLVPPGPPCNIRWPGHVKVHRWTGGPWCWTARRPGPFALPGSRSLRSS